MDWQEVIETIERYRDLFPLDAQAAVDKAIEALEKQIPKKPILRYVMKYTCPSCGKHFTGTGIADYCYHCGKALDWRNAE